MLTHWATNSRRERRTIARVAASESGTVSSAMPASSGEMEAIIARAAPAVSTAETTWPTIVESEVCTLSMSLVTRLNNSPRCRPSK